MIKNLMVQVQFDLTSLDVEAVAEAFEEIAKSPLVERFSLEKNSEEEYYTCIFGTEDLPALWELVHKTMYDKDSTDLGAGMEEASIAVCEGDEGWDDYLMLYHFHPDEPSDLLPPE